MRRKILVGLMAVCMMVTMFPTFALAGSQFTDVKDSDWFADSVQYVAENGLMYGVSDTEFAPNAVLTRSMFVTILGRYAGVDVSSYTGVSFSDVVPGQWYSNSVEWAYKNGITAGIGDGKFGVNEPVTREQMAVLIANYMKSEGITLPDADNSISGFVDADKVSDWAKEGLEVMRKSGIISGSATGLFMPKDTATRAMAAVIFEKLDKATKNLNTSEKYPVGSKVTFGAYEQIPLVIGKENISWIVLDNKDGHTLLVSEKVLDVTDFNDTYEPVTWATSSIRKWLNQNFYISAFTSTERQKICTTAVADDKASPIAGTKTYPDTNDKVFLLSKAEVEKYFSNKDDRKAASSVYARQNGVTNEDGAAIWWLRSTISTNNYAALVNLFGDVAEYTVQTDDEVNVGVRPAIWVDLDASDSSVKVQVGSSVNYGYYEQDNVDENGPEAIEWVVIAKQNGKSLLLSRNALESITFTKKAYGQTLSNDEVTWSGCNMANWLNNDFMNTALSSIEQKKIQTTTMDGGINPTYGTVYSKEKTADSKVFLLSAQEIVDYVQPLDKTMNLSQCAPTDHAIAQGAINNSGKCLWWTRTIGMEVGRTTYVDNTGTIQADGFNGFTATGLTARPAMWVDLG